VKKGEQLQRRLIEFAARTTRVAKVLPRTAEVDTSRSNFSGQDLLPHQTTRRHAQPRAGPISSIKLRIVLKELNETMSWLEQIVANGLCFPREKNGRNYRRKPGTLLDHRSFDKNSPSIPTRSDISDFGFEISNRTISKFPRCYVSTIIGSTKGRFEVSYP
jgi:hypothetical protein